MKKLFGTFLLWTGTLVIAYFLGDRYHTSTVDDDQAPVSDTSNLSSTGDPSPSEPIRVPGPIDRSLEELLVLDKEGERIYQFEYMVDQLDVDSLPLFMEELEALPACEYRRRWINRVMQKWGELDPEGAALYIESVPGAERMDMIGHMALGWSRNEPRNAWEYMMVQTNEGRIMNRGETMILREVAQSNPALAVEFVNELPEQAFSSVMFRILGLCAREKGNFKEVMDSLSGIANDSNKRIAMKEIWKDWAYYEPENALAEYQSMEEGKDKTEALSNLMAGWASNKPEDALAYCLENIPVENRGSAIKEIVKQWAENGDLEAATALVATLPVDKDSDEAVSAIVNHMAREDAASAMEWVQSMQNEERVRQGQRRVVAYWGSQDFEKAQAFVSEIPPGKEKNENLQSLFYSQMPIGKINDNAYQIIPLIEDQDMRDRCVLGLAQRAIFEFPARYNLTNTIDKNRVIQEIQNMEGISAEKRQEALTLLGVEKPGG